MAGRGIHRLRTTFRCRLIAREDRNLRSEAHFRSTSSAMVGWSGRTISQAIDEHFARIVDSRGVDDRELGLLPRYCNAGDQHTSNRAPWLQSCSDVAWFSTTLFRSTQHFSGSLVFLDALVPTPEIWNRTPPSPRFEASVAR